MTMAITVMSSTGLSNKWVRNALCQSESAVAAITGCDPYDYMNQAVISSPAGSNGVIFLPYLDGDFTPNNDANARGCFIGMDTNTRKADMLRAALEGMAFSILDNISLIREVGGSMNEILATGGMTKSDVWMQIISDVTGCSISLPGESEGTPFGNALIAGVGVGIFKSFEEAVKKTIRINFNAYQPNPENTKLYSDLFKIYRASYQALKDVFPKLTAFREEHNT
jgi:xylulokinase